MWVTREISNRYYHNIFRSNMEAKGEGHKQTCYEQFGKKYTKFECKLNFTITLHGIYHSQCQVHECKLMHHFKSIFTILITYLLILFLSTRSEFNPLTNNIQWYWLRVAFFLSRVEGTPTPGRRFAPVAWRSTRSHELSGYGKYFHDLSNNIV